MNGSGFTETSTESPSSKTLSSYIHRLDRFPEMHREGKVLQVIGHMVEATNPGCSVGGMCTIYNPADLNPGLIANHIILVLDRPDAANIQTD